MGKKTDGVQKCAHPGCYVMLRPEQGRTLGSVKICFSSWCGDWARRQAEVQ